MVFASRILIATTLFLSTTGFAEQEDLVTKEEQKQILQEIDNLCADTWCEGDFNYKFDEIFCTQWNPSEYRCTINFQLISTSFIEVDPAQNENFEGEFYETMPAQCTITGLKERSEIIDHDSRGNVRPGDVLLERFSQCTGHVESAFRKRLGWT